MLRILLWLIVFISTDVIAQSNMDWISDKQRNREYEIKAEENELTIDTNNPFEKTMSLPDQPVTDLLCDADVSISYSQMGDRVRVDAQVINEQCAASYGKYNVRVKTRDEDGETNMASHEESWSLDDASQLEATHYYDMNGDVELVWARIHAKPKDFCTCRNLSQAPEN